MLHQIISNQSVCIKFCIKLPTIRVGVHQPSLSGIRVFLSNSIENKKKQTSIGRISVICNISAVWRRGALNLPSGVQFDPHIPDERQGRQGCHAAPLQQDPQPISSAGIIASSLVQSSCQSWLKPTFPVRKTMENHHAMNGTIHYFHGHGFNSYFDITGGFP